MIEAKNLTMYYGATLALDDVSFSAKENEIVGLLGPNGAGKTTLMRILTTYIYPTHGSAKICGFDITQDPLSVRKVIGYLPEIPPLYMDMRVDEFIEFVGRSRGLSFPELRKRKDWVVEAVKISEVWRRIIGELSLGYKQRVGLAQALIHDPKVLILDEPTSGLDPMQIVGIRKLIRELAQEKTIVFSTHILQEASSVSDRLLIIDQGKIIAQGTVKELKVDNLAEKSLVVAIPGAHKGIEAALQDIPQLKEINFLGDIAGTSRFSCLASSYEEAVFSLNQIAKEKNWLIKELYIKEPSLEEVFLNLFKKADEKV